MSQPLLEVEALEAGYAEPVVGPLTFRVDVGEVVGLVGPNGAGKSTLLGAISDSVHVFSGRVRKRPGLSTTLMAQQPVRLPEMPFNGREYLAFAGAGDTEVPARLADWLDLRIDALSGGQFQLLSCWAALGGTADLVMLDEPTNNLDRESARTLVGGLDQRRSERGVLLVSHDRQFLEHVCDRIIGVEY